MHTFFVHWTAVTAYLGGGVGHCCRILLPNAKNPQWGKAIKEAIDTEGYMS